MTDCGERLHELFRRGNTGKGTDCLAELSEQGAGEESRADLVGSIEAGFRLPVQGERKRILFPSEQPEAGEYTAEKVVSAGGQADAESDDAAERVGGLFVLRRVILRPRLPEIPGGGGQDQIAVYRRIAADNQREAAPAGFIQHGLDGMQQGIPPGWRECAAQDRIVQHGAAAGNLHWTAAAEDDKLSAGYRDGLTGGGRKRLHLLLCQIQNQAERRERGVCCLQGKQLSAEQQIDCFAVDGVYRTRRMGLQNAARVGAGVGDRTTQQNSS